MDQVPDSLRDLVRAIQAGGTDAMSVNTFAAALYDLAHEGWEAARERITYEQDHKGPRPNEGKKAWERFEDVKDGIFDYALSTVGR